MDFKSLAANFQTFKILKTCYKSDFLKGYILKMTTTLFVLFCFCLFANRYILSVHPPGNPTHRLLQHLPPA